jgi:hypothetical protein
MFIGVVCDFVILCLAIPTFCFLNSHFWVEARNWKLSRLLRHLHFFVHLIWLERTRNGERLGRNGSAKLALALSDIVPNGC